METDEKQLITYSVTHRCNWETCKNHWCLLLLLLLSSLSLLNRS